MLFWYTPQIVGFNTAAVGLLQEQSHIIEQLSARIDSLVAENDHLKDRFEEELASLNERLNAMSDVPLKKDLAEVRAELVRLPQEMVRNDQELLGYIKSGDAARDRIAEEARERMSAAEARVAQFRTMLFAQERLQGQSSRTEAVARPRAEDEHQLDNLYLMLEDKLRGSREEIRSKLTKYLPYLNAASRPVLDIGCGRGEWLELLREHGIEAQGVDLNRTFVSLCGDLGLNVVLDDAIENLRARANASLGAVTGFHIVEHLPWAKLVELLDETVRVLKPGGIAIFETPNPENVLVGSRNFYLDPTHRNPLPSMLLEFLLDARGFSQVEILPLHPCPASVRVPDDGSTVTTRFNQYFYGPQDYAVVGRKAQSPA